MDDYTVDLIAAFQGVGGEKQSHIKCTLQLYNVPWFYNVKSKCIMESRKCVCFYLYFSLLLLWDLLLRSYVILRAILFSPPTTLHIEDLDKYFLDD